MTETQQGTVYRYLRIDADHDVSTRPLALTLDYGVTWIVGQADYIAPGDLPPSAASANIATPPRGGLTGYWWRILTGPSTAFPLHLSRNVLRGRLTDNPEVPHVQWVIQVADYE